MQNVDFKGALDTTTRQMVISAVMTAWSDPDADVLVVGAPWWAVDAVLRDVTSARVRGMPNTPQADIEGGGRVWALEDEDALQFVVSLEVSHLYVTKYVYPLGGTTETVLLSRVRKMPRAVFTPESWPHARSKDPGVWFREKDSWKEVQALEAGTSALERQRDFLRRTLDAMLRIQAPYFGGIGHHSPLGQDAWRALWDAVRAALIASAQTRGPAITGKANVEVEETEFDRLIVPLWEWLDTRHGGESETPEMGEI